MKPDPKAILEAKKAIDPISENPLSARTRKKALLAAINATSTQKRSALTDAEDENLFAWVMQVLSGAGCLQATWHDALDKCRAQGWKPGSIPPRKWLVKQLEG